MQLCDHWGISLTRIILFWIAVFSSQPAWALPNSSSIQNQPEELSLQLPEGGVELLGHSTQHSFSSRSSIEEEPAQSIVKKTRLTPLLTQHQFLLANEANEVGDDDETSPQQSSEEPVESNDPELGIIRLREVPVEDPELGIIRLREIPATDSELGDIRLRPVVAEDPELGLLQLRPLSPEDPELGVIQTRPPIQEPELEGEAPTVKAPKRPILYLGGRVQYFRSDNILSSEVDPRDDGLFEAGVSLQAIPRLGPSTYLIGTVSEELIRYADLSEFDYNDLSLSLSLYQVLTPRTYGQLGWRNQQLFSLNDGDRFLNNHAAFFALGRRDSLASDLRLDTNYQLSLNFADPRTRNRLINTLGTTLTYKLASDLNVSLGYQLSWVEFSEQDRSDFSQRALVTLSYKLAKGNQFSVFGGFRQGGSSNSVIDFDGALIGVQWAVNLPLF